MSRAPIDLQVTLGVVGDYREISLSGRLDAHQVMRLLDVAQPLAPHTRLNLGGVSFMDSSGLAALVRLSREAQAQGLRLEITQVRDAVRLAMEITGLYALLPVVHEGPDAAHDSV